MVDYRTLDVPVAGGKLRVGDWGQSGPVLVACHGITGNHVSFAALADQLGGRVRLLAPDHRGRGGSREIDGPWGMRAHAADVKAVLDHLSIEKADILLGHSMGGFVAAVTTAEHGDRIGSVLLVDGGLPLMDRVPEGSTTEELTRALIGPAMERLDRTFESKEAYRAFWRWHPALANDWSGYVERYFDYDLVGEPPTLRSSVRKDAALGDAASQLSGDLVSRSLESMHGPVRFLRAPRGILNNEPLYSQERLESWASRIGGFSAATIEDVNHYTILLSQRGARAVADEVDRLLALRR